MVADAPPAIISPAQVEHAIVVYGDNDAMIALKVRVDARGATTSWASAGKPKAFSLYIAVDGSTPTAENRAFIDTVNRKEFGNLNAGFAKIGAGN